MFIKYVANSGWTVPQVGADIGLLLTGGTIGECSASCNKVSSTQLGIGEWTMYDADAPISTGFSVVMASDADSMTTKYHRIGFSAASAATSLQIYSYEGWNAGTNAVSVGVATTQSSCAQVTVGTATVFYILAESTMWFAAYAGTSSPVAAIAGELLRDTPYMLTTNGVIPPAHFNMISSSLQCYFPKLRNPAVVNAFVTNSSVPLPLYASRVSYSTATPTTDTFDNNGAAFVQTQPVFLCSSQGYLYGRMRGNIKFGYSTYPSIVFGDTLMVGGQEHLICGSLLLPIQ